MGDYGWNSKSGKLFALSGGACVGEAKAGVFGCHLISSVGDSNWYIGAKGPAGIRNNLAQVDIECSAPERGRARATEEGKSGTALNVESIVTHIG